MNTRSFLRSAGLSIRHVSLVGDLFENGEGYDSYKLPKRRGGFRTIYVADAEVSSVLKLLLRALEVSGLYQVPDCVHGYVKGRSIRSNASKHLDRDVVLSVDLEDFFPSISLDKTCQSLVAHGAEDDLALAIARATAIEGHLAPGLSPSPWLSNLIFRDCDMRLMHLSDSLGVTYSRFADDLTFSGQFGDEVLDAVTEELGTLGWTLNNRKTRFMRRGGPQYVTGLYVGRADQPYIPRRFKRTLRMRLHYLAKYGYSDVESRGRGEEMFHSQAAGWIRHIWSLEPRAAKRFEALFEEVDFGTDYVLWSDPDAWTDLLAEVGLRDDPRLG